MKLVAPYPMVTTTVNLPNPEFGDTENHINTVEFKRSQDNTRYSYVKSRGQDKRLSFRLKLTRKKALELRAFIISYHDKKIKLTDHLSQNWIGYITTNPNEFEITGAAKGSPGEATSEIQIEFRGTKL